MKHYFKPQWSRGTASRQAHCDLPEGTVEREISKEGFMGPAAMIHHRRPPTGWSAMEGPLRPHLFDLNRLQEASASPWQAPVILRNDACEIRLWRLAEAMPALARDADGDLLLFVHDGGGALFCDYGHMDFSTGDYIMLPRGTAWRLEPAGRATLLMVESTGAPYRLPARWLAC
ncbi:MAG: homogentisate 1,2-dioxygenase, partial [Proteobacteria bacterium]|nr:homogentisate 1,2-dioxygenase [Pseudomonadota bacterium]